MRSTVAILGLAFWLAASPSASAVARVSPPPVAIAAPAPAPFPQAALTQIDSIIANKLPTYRTWQENYFANHGRYFQATITHSVIPKDGAAATPDQLANGPTDQPDKNAALWSGAALPNKTPFALRIDQYTAPTGPGHVAVLAVVIGGATWSRTINTGPEVERDSGWRMIAPGTVITP